MQSIRKTRTQATYSIIDQITEKDQWLYTPRSFIYLTGDPVQGAMTARMVYWCKHSVRRDDFVYKSSRDWFLETGASDHAVRKFKKQPYVETKILKANGVPTTHYRINEEKLYAALLKIQQDLNLLTMPDDDQDEWTEDGSIGDEAQDLTDEFDEYSEWNGDEPLVLVGNAPNPCDESDRSITNNTTKETTENTHNKGYPPLKTPDPGSLPNPGISTKHKHKPKLSNEVYTLASSEPYQAMMAKMSEVTGFDPQLKANQARLNKAVSQLVRNDYTTDMIDMFFRDWIEKDWRWQKNHQSPSPEQVIQGIGKYKHPAKCYAKKWLGQE
jgi:hypothetical protein